MLLQFSVTNHRSIKETSIISLKASTDKSLADCLISPDEKKQLVPVLALYGANLWEQKCGWMPHCLLSGRAALKRAVSCMKCCAQTSASRTSALPAPRTNPSSLPCTRWIPGRALPRDSGFLWGWNRSAHSGSSPASGCGWPLWNPGLCWS